MSENTENNNSDRKITSLTSPSDRGDKKYEMDMYAPFLTTQETKDAVNDLVSSENLKRYPAVDRFYKDPQYKDQVYCLHSFYPSKGATPDKDGVYGMFKCRGTFSNEMEMNQR